MAILAVSKKSKYDFLEKILNIKILSTHGGISIKLEQDMDLTVILSYCLGYLEKNWCFGGLCRAPWVNSTPPCTARRALSTSDNAVARIRSSVVKPRDKKSTQKVIPIHPDLQEAYNNLLSFWTDKINFCLEMWSYISPQTPHGGISIKLEQDFTYLNKLICSVCVCCDFWLLFLVFRKPMLFGLT